MSTLRIYKYKDNNKTTKIHLYLLAYTCIAGIFASVSTPLMAAENILPATTIIGEVDNDSGQQIGDVDIPSCNSFNLGFNSINNSTWTVKSDIGTGSTVFVGQEWQVSFEVRHPRQRRPGLDIVSVGNDGINPLYLNVTPQGPVDSGATPIGEIPNLDWFVGDGVIALNGPVGPWQFSFDGDSDPKSLLPPQTSDPVSAKITVTLRATSPGLITLPEVTVSGYDDTPIAGAVSCGPMAVNMSWNVVAKKDLIAFIDVSNVDAAYTQIDSSDRTTGPHGIRIDVLANDSDPEIPGSTGDTNEIRMSKWDTVSALGATVICGSENKNPAPPEAEFFFLEAGPCTYIPPLDVDSGTDSFKYTIRGANRTADEEQEGIVLIEFKANQAPIIAAPVFGTTPGVDSSFDLTPQIIDPEADPFTCFPDGPTSPAGNGTALIQLDCSMDWDNTNPGFTGNISVPFKVCDAHNTLQNGDFKGATTRTPAYAGFDLNENQTRRCNTGTATIAILPGLIIPPTGVSDKDILNAGYSADGVGAYSLSIPVLANDTDGNGPNPTMPSADLAVITPPAVEQGSASFVGDRLVFTPADEFSGVVSMTYRVCEDPAEQDPPYFDDPNTPLINEGLPFCGVGAVSIVVLGNAAPVVNPDATAIADDALLTGFDLGANDIDPDGDPIACTAGVPVSNNPDLVESANVSADCKLSFNPVNGQAGVVEFTYEVCDQHTLTNPSYPAVPYGSDGLSPGDISSRCSTGTATVTVSVAPPPEPNPEDTDPDPVCVADVAQTGIGTPVVISVLDNDSDLDANLQPSAVILTGPPADEPDVSAEGGSVKMNDANTIIYAPPLNFQGTDTFSYTARDEFGQACKAGVTVTVNGLGGGNNGEAIAIPSLSRWAQLLLVLLMVGLAIKTTRVSKY